MMKFADPARDAEQDRVGIVRCSRAPTGSGRESSPARVQRVPTRSSGKSPLTPIALATATVAHDRHRRDERDGGAASGCVRWRRVGSVRSATASVIRSSAIAITTITIPARIASAGYEFSPLVTTSPSPLPPMSPAMTTIESANRIVWLTPRSSVRRASGSCTFCSICRPSSPSPARPRPCSPGPADAERGDADPAGSRRSSS